MLGDFFVLFEMVKGDAQKSGLGFDLFMIISFVIVFVVVLVYLLSGGVA